MKCGTYIWHEQIGNKKKKRPHHIPMVHAGRNGCHIQAHLDGWDKHSATPQDFAPCDGRVIANVSIGVTGGCECCGTIKIQVTYKCDKCSETYFPELPREGDDLGVFLQRFLDATDDEGRIALIEDAKRATKKMLAASRKTLGREPSAGYPWWKYW